MLMKERSESTLCLQYLEFEWFPDGRVVAQNHSGRVGLLSDGDRIEDVENGEAFDFNCFHTFWFIGSMRGCLFRRTLTLNPGGESLDSRIA